MIQHVTEAGLVGRELRMLRTTKGGHKLSKIRGGGKIGKKIIDLPRGQINDPLSWENHSLLFLPATPSSLSRLLLPELQRNKDTVRCGPL